MKKFLLVLIFILVLCGQSWSAEQVNFGADNAEAATVKLGSLDPESGYNFELELDSRGAAIGKATFSGFDDRHHKNPKPLVLLSPVRELDGREYLSMANKGFVFVEHNVQLLLDRLHWKSLGVEKGADSETAKFEAVIKTTDGEPVMKIVKSYTVYSGSYKVDCDISIENLSIDEHKVRFDMAGPLGVGREGFRSDMRKAVAGFVNEKGKITSDRRDIRKLAKAKTVDVRRLLEGRDTFLWVAVTNKYFAAVVVPLADEGKDYADWIQDKTGRFYNPDRDAKRDSGDETVGVDLKIASTKLGAGDVRNYKFNLYLGPKDKKIFDENEQYRRLGFIETIDFMGCCCPTAIIRPLAFGILGMMKWLYTFVPNYGVAIIILVFLIRIALHPLTKKSQISMSKMSKLAPKSEEIKKKYAGNKAEMNKQMMALYREEGASPVMGMLPMLVQMPILIALWSAIYTSIDLRGAAFLPFWITDLSAPDALIRFATITIPLVGWKVESFNLLPILMGVAMYMQQRMMPSTAAASPQAAQQQKMMKIMMPLMFPLILYKGPSGVNLYFMASTFAGVIEQHIIRKHIREKEEAQSQGLVSVTAKTGGKAKKKKPKPFFKSH